MPCRILDCRIIYPNPPPAHPPSDPPSVKMQFRSEIRHEINNTCLFAFDQLLSFLFFSFFFARGQKKGCDCRLVG